MSWVPKRKKKCAPPQQQPSTSVVSHSESVSDTHHHRHHDEIHQGPGGSYVSHEEMYHQHGLPADMRRLELHVVDPHDEPNQLLVQFPVIVTSTAEKLQNDPEEREKLQVNIWECMLKAARKQALKVYNEQGCAVDINLSCMKGFVYKICIRGYENSFPFRIAARFPGTECAYVMDANGEDEGTFCLDAETPYCCDTLCVYEAKHKESVKKQLRKYGGYHTPEELWPGMIDFTDHAYVPINCMGAHIVLQNRYNAATGKGFPEKLISEDIVKTDGRGIEYYSWDISVIRTINERFSSNVLPEIQGKLIDFTCPESRKYVIEHVRADTDPDGKKKRKFTDREGTIHGNDEIGNAAFTTRQRIRYNCSLYMGFTTKASIREICC